VVTASHNPDPWNGLKFIDRSGLFLSPFRAQNLLDIYHQQSFIAPSNNHFPDLIEVSDGFDEHAQAIIKVLDTERIRKRGFRVFCDPGGGVGCKTTRTFLETLGCQVTAIHDTPEVCFPRHPEPLPENLTRAMQEMQNGHFDIGFVQDPDGDRLMVLDESGTPIGGEKTLALALDGYLPYQKKGKVVVNLSTSRLSEWICKRHGFDLLRAPVGEINVTEMMLQEEAVAGGEGNGGIIIPAIHPCRDSYAGMALILQALSQSPQAISKQVGQYPQYRMLSKKIPTCGSGAYKITTKLLNRYPDADCRDGIRVDRERYWFHIRASNTEPVMRICAEGSSPEVDSIFHSLVRDIEEMLL
jgi:phosphomannomutase